MTVEDCEGHPVDVRAWLADHDAAYMLSFGAL